MNGRSVSFYHRPVSHKMFLVEGFRTILHLPYLGRIEISIVKTDVIDGAEPVPVRVGGKSQMQRMAPLTGVAGKLIPGRLFRSVDVQPAVRSTKHHRKVVPCSRLGFRLR